MRMFRNARRQAPYESGKFTPGQDLKILYTFVSHTPGDRLSHWF